MHAGNHFDQRGFAGTIFTEQGLYLAAANGQGDVFNDVDGAEGFGDINELKNGVVVFVIGHCVHLLAEVLGEKSMDSRGIKRVSTTADCGGDLLPNDATRLRRAILPICSTLWSMMDTGAGWMRMKTKSSKPTRAICLPMSTCSRYSASKAPKVIMESPAIMAVGCCARSFWVPKKPSSCR